jgi:hypothetical protein
MFDKNDIIRMAKECGFTIEEGWVMCLDENKRPYMELPSLIRCAALVAAAEREACIDIVAMHGGSVEIEAAIRARGQA